jgi:hypothetical protein
LRIWVWIWIRELKILTKMKQRKMVEKEGKSNNGYNKKWIAWGNVKWTVTFIS